MAAKNSSDSPPPDEPDDKSSQEFLPPMDFSSIVFPIFTQILFKLGILKDQASPEPSINLKLARRLIDILDLLKERTKGNLLPDEQEFLDSCLHQVKTAYLEKAKIIQV